MLSSARMKTMLKPVATTIAILLASATGIAAANAAVDSAAEAKAAAAAAALAAAEAKAAAATANKVSDDIKDWGFGLGIGIEQYRNKYIDQAGTYGTDRLVLIEKDYKTLPSAWLTLNWNVWGDEKKKMRYGFFTGIKLLDSNSQVFSAFSLGPQITFKTQERNVSVGFGWVTHRTKKLANGISEGSALPAHYTDIKYKEGSENSYMLMFSVGL